MSHEPKSFDKEAVMQRVDNDRELLHELVALFFSEYIQTQEKLRKALTDNQAEEFKRAAHSVKGAAGNVGAMIVHDLAFQLERTGAAGDLSAATAKLEEFETAINQFKTDFEIAMKS